MILTLRIICVLKKEVDKAKIKADLLAGAEIAGAYLVENKNLQVR